MEPNAARCTSALSRKCLQRVVSFNVTLLLCAMKRLAFGAITPAVHEGSSASNHLLNRFNPYFNTQHPNSYMRKPNNLDAQEFLTDWKQETTDIEEDTIY
uniref:AlNc14C141G7254 protein n=1 Tax=Albugo laibachii Nc14 TaxID=890382 RepID=F0WL66_9STRA|nr:AlNc14C141G7254 [Albugo laibachii Nc14]|eukprot:CCA22027.1 AlNc14C141G7254 [Albugo laibachii Nc14]